MNSFKIKKNIIDLNKDTVTIICEFTKRSLDKYAQVEIYDSKKRYFNMEKSWNSFEYYVDLFVNNKFNLNYYMVEGTLCVFLEHFSGNSNYPMYISENTLSKKHLSQLESEYNDLLEQINLIQIQINSIKTLYPTNITIK